ncbi:molybdopterin molybdotransferase MoeA [Nesterenkonia muleiensis]|uniref:molybdopterin molybdotransferase MoeA n=1 Tax=Nesterenkonia muleiensis TaxID=2282648 RepID=UPI000E7259DC|nr:molybdopterin molybdotransferase MoeA [Nesterenkonia muleiensis]
MVSPLPFGQARSIAASAAALVPVRRPLAVGIGCVLAEPLNAQLNIPHAATSAMDGWAITSGQQRSWWLRADGADRPATVLDPLAAGQAVAVVTGSPVPEGAHSVLRSEHGHIEHSEAQGAVLRADPGTPDLEPGRNIRPEAAEARVGELLCEPGQVLTAPRAAAAAVAGYDELTVIPRPRVRLVLTGDEVISSGLPARGQVRDVFGLALPSMLGAMGAELVGVHRLGDDTAGLVSLIELRFSEPGLSEQGCSGQRSWQTDGPELVITTGGTAHSRADALRPALERLEAEVLVGSVDMRPGHPAMLARHGRTYVLGLPGNPLAGFAALAVLGEPLIRALRGITPAVSSRILRASNALKGARSAVRLLPVHIREDDAQPLSHASSHMMRGLAAADAFAVVPTGGIAAGEQVECLQVPGSFP